MLNTSVSIRKLHGKAKLTLSLDLLHGGVSPLGPHGNTQTLFLQGIISDVEAYKEFCITPKSFAASSHPCGCLFMQSFMCSGI